MCKYLKKFNYYPKTSLKTTLGCTLLQAKKVNLKEGCKTYEQINQQNIVVDQNE